MLVDIVAISKNIYSEIIEKDVTLENPNKLYDSYRSLKQVIESSNLVANHYLALSFKEDCLQNSSIGSAIDKWKYFLNKDLNQLNEAIKKYLLTIYEIVIISDKNPTFGEESILENYFNSKIYYDFVRREYSCGYVNSENLTLCMNLLVTLYDNQSYNILNKKEIDLSTYENRKDLKEHLHTQIKELEHLETKLKIYIQTKFTITDLL
ncbi:MAG: hypothetical protein U5K55_01075 [Aliarcobacter sp.]|nr:hypothetical protein [Aliarcobacter sp.]